MIQTTDSNILAYQELLKDEAACERLHGKYVAFVNGTLVSSGSDRRKLIESLIEKFPGSMRFISKIPPEPPVDIPTIFSVQRHP